MVNSKIIPKHQNIFIIIPAYNESTVIQDVIRNLQNYLTREQIILVDDGSNDNTYQIGVNEGVIAVKHAFNRGQGAALMTGIRIALELEAQIIVTFDADGQHRSEDIPCMIEPILNGEADVVLGSRFLNENSNIPFLRKVILKAGVSATKYLSKANVTDTHNGFRAMNRTAAQLIRLSQDNMTHASEFIEQIVQNKLSYVERPVYINYSDYSKAKGQKNFAAFKLVVQIILYKILFS
jgi:glycosyltransferase involved in cell wall biosynthesis